MDNFRITEARKKLYINRSQLHDLCIDDPRLPARTVKTILKKFLAKNPTITLPMSTEYGLYKKPLSKYVKRVQLLTRLNRNDTNHFEQIDFGSADFRRLGRVISESKYIKDLTLLEIHNLPLSCIKQIQKLTNLTSLTLLIKTVWFEEKSSIQLDLTRFRKLKKVALHFDSSKPSDPLFRDRYNANFSRFSQNLTKCSQLKKLEIELDAQKNSSIRQSIQILLTSLNMLKIDSFNLIFRPRESHFLELDTMRNLLEKVDELGFYFSLDSRIKDSRKDSKSLKFIFPGAPISFDIFALIKHCANLETLWLKIPFSVMFIPRQLILRKDLKRLFLHIGRYGKNEDIQMLLRQIWFWSNALKKVSCLEDFRVEILDWEGILYPALIQFHQLDCFKNLQSYSISIHITVLNPSGSVRVEDLAQLIEPLKTVGTWQITLDNLVDDFQEPKFWDLLYSKENMRNLSMKISPKKFGQKMDFPFKKFQPMQQLEKLEIEIDELEEKSSILRKLPVLSNIKDFKIKARNWSIDMAEYDKLRKALLS